MANNKCNGADEKNFAGERQKTSDDQPNDSEAPTTTSSTSTAVIPISTRTMDTMKDSFEAASKQKCSPASAFAYPPVKDIIPSKLHESIHDLPSRMQVIDFLAVSQETRPEKLTQRCRWSLELYLDANDKCSIAADYRCVRNNSSDSKRAGSAVVTFFAIYKEAVAASLHELALQAAYKVLDYLLLSDYEPVTSKKTHNAFSLSDLLLQHNAQWLECIEYCNKNTDTTFAKNSPSKAYLGTPDVGVRQPDVARFLRVNLLCPAIPHGQVVHTEGVIGIRDPSISPHESLGLLAKFSTETMEKHWNHVQKIAETFHSCPDLDELVLPDAIRKQLQEDIIGPLEFPESYRQRPEGILGYSEGTQTLQNTKAVSVVLFLGPTGVGKTTVAKALGARVNKSAFYLITPADLNNKFVGESERFTRTLFNHALVHQPAMIFLDDIEALCSSRDEQAPFEAHSALLRCISQLTAEPCQVIVAGATNYPHRVDTAFLRQVQARIYLPLPTKALMTATHEL